MEVDFTRVFENYDGTCIPLERAANGGSQPVLDENGERIDLTLRLVAIEVLGPVEKMSGQEKCRRDRLAERIFRATESIEVSKDEAELLKRLIDKWYAHPRIVRQAWDLLTPTKKEKTK
jgi:hypothetical protein